MKRYLITNIKDLDGEILKKLDDHTLCYICSLNKQYYLKVCNNKFFHNVILVRYPETVKYKDVNKLQDWRNYFRIIFKYVTLLRKEFDYEYKPEDRSPQLKYFSYVCVRNSVKNENEKEAFIRDDNLKGIFVCACEAGSLPVVKYLMENGIDSVSKSLGLVWASKKGHLSVVKYLTEHGDNIEHQNNLPIKCATAIGNLDIVKYLVEKGVNIHLLFNDLLPLASQYNHLNVVEYLLENGADINANNGEALDSAIALAKLEMAKYLIEHGANIQAGDNTALRTACAYGHFTMVKDLVELGADIHAVNDEALKLASNWGFITIVEYLVELGANVNAEDEDNHGTPLSLASGNGHLNIVKYLVEHGADYNNDRSPTSINWLNENGQSHVAEYLQSLQ